MGEPRELNIPYVGLNLGIYMGGDLAVGGSTDDSDFAFIPRAGGGGRVCLSVSEETQRTAGDSVGGGGSGCYAVIPSHDRGLAHQWNLRAYLSLFSHRLEIGGGLTGSLWQHPDDASHGRVALEVGLRYYLDRSGLRQFQFRPFVGGDVSLGIIWGGSDNDVAVSLALNLEAGIAFFF